MKPGSGQFVPDRVAGEPEGPRVDNQDAADALTQQSRQRAEQAASNHDVVVVPGRLAGDLDDG